MTTNLSLRKFVFVLFSILTLSCSFVSSIVLTPTPPPTGTPIGTSTITKIPTFANPPTKTITPTPHYTVELTTQVKFQAGGFNLSRLKGYDVIVSPAHGSMISADKKVNVFLFAGENFSGLTVKGLVKDSADNIKSNYEDFTASDPLVETQNGVEKGTVEFTGTQDDEPVSGRITVYDPPDSKLLYVYVFAIGEKRWEREGQQVYEQVTASISFSPIEIMTDCPIHTNRGYGTSAESPIKIGGGLRSGEDRIINYLDVLLGPKGEFVGYYREGVEAVGGVELEKYFIRYGNSEKYLYFDIYSYAAAKAPFGMTCSTSFPIAPSQ